MSAAVHGARREHSGVHGARRATPHLDAIDLSEEFDDRLVLREAVAVRQQPRRIGRVEAPPAQRVGGRERVLTHHADERGVGLGA